VSGSSGAPPTSGSRVRRSAPVPDDGAPLFTVSQAAAILGVQQAFLRRLDSERVVTPARSTGGQRRYSRTDLDHVAAIVELMDTGVTLAGAQRIIDLENEVAHLRERLDDRRAASDP
jgi:MerR family transcriptional regulator/heat shock protein HspR